MNKIELHKNKVIANIFNVDCIEGMKSIPAESIDTVICDLPYGTTNNKWDITINCFDLWKSLDRICKNGANIILTATQPFTSILIDTNKSYLLYKNKQLSNKIKTMINEKDIEINKLITDIIELNSTNKKTWFRYSDVYEKLTNASGQLNVNIMPLRKHEDILVFRKDGKKISECTYNEELSTGEPYKITRKIDTMDCYGSQREHTIENNGTRRAISIMRVKNPRIKNGHPTAKPYELIERLVKIYSNENDLVLDMTVGSGTTAFACLNNNRNFIGYEISKEYFDTIINSWEKINK